MREIKFRRKQRSFKIQGRMNRKKEALHQTTSGLLILMQNSHASLVVPLVSSLR